VEDHIASALPANGLWRAGAAGRPLSHPFSKLELSCRLIRPRTSMNGFKLGRCGRACKPRATKEGISDVRASGGWSAFVDTQLVHRRATMGIGLTARGEKQINFLDAPGDGLVGTQADPAVVALSNGKFYCRL
jgi:hypothetical protein